ncbi:matrixin family metalloprotease [Halorientalis salina]|uniref:matrixin family metalloprotease n=1 Tax=Halorientalis salina TaxID=2932266 RepID=UPI0010AB5E32|nr:matrixin family metalloprotease [Halorientalis salina]
MHRSVALAALVVLAGCSLPVPPLGSPDESAAVDPWSETTFVVGLDAGTDDSRSKYVAALRNATDYWEANADQYLGHPVTFRVDPDAEDPDLVVRPVERIDECGTDDHAAGCAPLLSDLRTQDDPVEVRIKRGFDRNSTRLVLRHEFGHVLGLGHTDDPQSVMRAETVLASTPQPNASERPVPWDDPTLSVYVDDDTLSADERRAVDDQIGHAIDYYNDGGERTVPDNVTFARTTDRDTADIVVSFPDSSPCGESPSSCAEIVGVDSDRDGAHERYTRADIYVVGLSTEATGWHVGRWFGGALGSDDRADLPPAFRDATFEERRSDWWE